MAISITMSRRTFLQRLAVLGAVSASAAACTPAPAAPVAPQAAEPAKPAAAATQPAAAPAAKVEIKGSLQIVQKQDFFPSMNDWFQAEVKAFCKEKGWPVEVSYEAGYTGGTPFIEKLAAAASAGTPADLLMHTDAMVDLVRLKVVDPVTDIVNQVSAKWGNPSARQKFDMVKDSLWYYVPYFQRSDGGWFQRPVFKDKGIDLAKIRSYKDLWEACLAVTDPGKQIYGWGVTINRGGDGDWFRNRVMHGWGAYVQDETGQYVTINSPQMVEAMTTMTDLYLKDKWKPMLPPGVLAWTDTGNNENYLAGKLAYTQNGGTVYGKAILDKNPIKDITGFHPPVGGPVNPEFNSLSANYFAMLKGAKNAAAAKELLLHFLLPIESMDNIFSNAPGFALPAYEKLWAESKYIPTNPVALEQKAVATSATGNVVAGTYPGPSMNAAMGAAGAAGIQNDMVSDILRGTPVADAVKTCHERYVKVFKEFNLPGQK